VSNRTLSLTGPIYDYLLSVSLREPAALRRLREETAGMELAVMQIAPEQGQFMAFLVRLLGARRTIEVGTYTGYSALAVALALPEDGRVIACDINEAWTSVARRHWAAAGVAHKIELRLAPALETLDRLLGAGEAGRFDFAFIDADKTEYEGYFERCLALLRPGGVATVDNVLWDGKVADSAVSDRGTRAIRAFNQKLHADDRVDLSLVPIGDGLTLARKR